MSFGVQRQSYDHRESAQGLPRLIERNEDDDNSLKKRNSDLELVERRIKVEILALCRSVVVVSLIHQTSTNRTFKFLDSGNSDVENSCKNGLEGERKSVDIKPKNSLFLK